MEGSAVRINKGTVIAVKLEEPDPDLKPLSESDASLCRVNMNRAWHSSEMEDETLLPDFAAESYDDTRHISHHPRMTSSGHTKARHSDTALRQCQVIGAAEDVGEALIRHVRAYPCLYNTKHKSFKDNARKREAWERLSKELETPVFILKMKWRSLRSRHSRELKKRKLSSGSATNSNDSTWYMMPLMEYLEPHTNNYERLSSMMGMQDDGLDSQDESSQNFSMLSDNAAPSPPCCLHDGQDASDETPEAGDEMPKSSEDPDHASLGMQRKRKEEESVLDHSLETISSLLIQRLHQKEKEETEEDVFCRAMALKLKTLCENCKNDTMSEIYQLVHSAQKKDRSCRCIDS